MNKYLRISLFGILIWLIVFGFSFLIYPIRVSNRVLFESIIPVILTISVLGALIIYLRKTSKNFLKEGFLTGIIWFFINFFIDLILFMPESPMKLSFLEYIQDIGVTYLIIPIICIATGFLLKNHSESSN